MINATSYMFTIHKESDETIIALVLRYRGVVQSNEFQLSSRQRLYQ